jgi:hypothetical protein
MPKDKGYPAGRHSNADKNDMNDPRNPKREEMQKSGNRSEGKKEEKK